MATKKKLDFEGSMARLEEIVSLLERGDAPLEQAMEMEEERQLLANILKALPERQRQIVILKYFEDMTSGQIADRLGMTESNVRVQLFRAMKKMQDMLTD